MKNPANIAFATVTKILAIGSMKEGAEDKWRSRSAEFHILKSIGHNLKALQLLRGDIIDEETVIEHVERALTRDAMALTALLDDEAPMQTMQHPEHHEHAIVRHEIHHSPTDSNRPGGTSPEFYLQNTFDPHRESCNDM